MGKHTKYKKLRLQQSIDGGPWYYVVPAQYKRGDVIEENSTDCGYIPTQYRWYALPDEDEYMCDGYNKYYKLIYQQSEDNGKTWENVVPEQYKRGELRESNSKDCDYGITWVDVPLSYSCIIEDGMYVKYQMQQKYYLGEPVVPAEYRYGEKLGTYSTRAECIGSYRLMVSDDNGNMSIKDIEDVDDVNDIVGIILNEETAKEDGYYRVMSIKYADSEHPDDGVYQPILDTSYMDLSSMDFGFIMPLYVSTPEDDYLGFEHTYIFYTALETLFSSEDQKWRTEPVIIDPPSDIEGDDKRKYPGVPGIKSVWRFHTKGTNTGDWYIPSAGELKWYKKTNGWDETILNTNNPITDDKIPYLKVYITESKINEKFGDICVFPNTNLYQYGMYEIATSTRRYRKSDNVVNNGIVVINTGIDTKAAHGFRATYDDENRLYIPYIRIDYNTMKPINKTEDIRYSFPSGGMKMLVYDNVMDGTSVINYNYVNKDTYPFSRYQPIGYVYIDPSENVYGDGSGMAMGITPYSDSMMYIDPVSSEAQPPYITEGNQNQIINKFDGKERTKLFIETLPDENDDWKTEPTISHSHGNSEAIKLSWRYKTLGTQNGDWYLHSGGELYHIFYKYDKAQQQLDPYRWFVVLATKDYSNMGAKLYNDMGCSTSFSRLDHIWEWHLPESQFLYSQNINSDTEGTYWFYPVIRFMPDGTIVR